MAYDEALADRVRAALGPDARVIEIRMFGGLCFMVRGHMTCGIIRDGLMVRVGRDDYDRMAAKPHAGPMTFTGKPMKGIVVVSHEGCATARGVKTWVARALTFNATLPEKTKPRKKKRRPSPGMTGVRRLR
jgi:TfoX/Sxy family transcriptional regulator of competence genes